MKKVLLSCIFITLSIWAFSQDLIIRTNGDKLYCKITKVDSLNVYLTFELKGKEVNTFISKSSVQSINYGNKPTENNNAIGDLKKNRFALTIGPSFAMGDFGSSDMKSIKSGLAGTGAHLNLIYFTHKFTPNLGIGFKWYGNSNLFETESFVDDLNSATGVRWTSEPSAWGSGGLLGGFVGTLPNGKVTLEFRALGGYTTLSSPEAKFTMAGTNNWIKMETSVAAAFGYNLGVGLDYLFSDSWSFLANLDYLGGTFQFGDMTMTSSTGAAQVVKGAEQTFDVLNITVGIGYNFNTD